MEHKNLSKWIDGKIIFIQFLRIFSKKLEMQMKTVNIFKSIVFLDSVNRVSIKF